MLRWQINIVLHDNSEYLFFDNFANTFSKIAIADFYFRHGVTSNISHDLGRTIRGVEIKYVTVTKPS